MDIDSDKLTDDKKRGWNLACTKINAYLYDNFYDTDAGTFKPIDSDAAHKLDEYVNNIMVNVKPDGAPDDWSIQAMERGVKGWRSE